MTELADEAAALAQGERDLAAGDGRAALEAFDRALALRPESVDAAAGRVRAHLLLRDIVTARDLVSSLLRSSPESTAAHMAHGWVALGARDYAAVFTLDCAGVGQDAGEALDAFERALALEPSCVAALRGRVIALRATGRLEEARAALTAALDRVGPCAPLLVEQAWQARDESRLDDAVQAIEHALAIDPDDVDALVTAARLMRNALGPGADDVVLRAAERLAPDSPRTNEQRAWSELARSETVDSMPEIRAMREEAGRAFERVLERLPGYPGALTGLAYVARLRSGPAAQGERLDAALAVDDRSPELNVERGLLATELGEPALPYFERARSAAPHLVTAWEGCVIALAASGRLASAQDTLDAMAATFGVHPRVVSARYYLAISAGRHEEAVTGADEYALSAPRPQGVLAPPDALLVVDSRTLLGDVERAETVAYETLGVYSANPFLIDRLAWCAESEGRRHAALALARRAAELAPHDPTIEERLRSLRRSMRRRPLYRLFGRSVDNRADQWAAASDQTAELIERLVPEGSQAWVAGRLRALRWARDRIVVGSGTIRMAVLVVALVAVAVAPWVTADVVASDTRAWLRVLATAVALAVFVVLAVVVGTWSVQRALAVMGVVLAVAAWPAASVWSRLDGQPRFALMSVVVLPYAGIVLSYAVLTAFAVVQERRISRLPMPDALLLEALLHLAVATEVPIEQWTVEGRRQGVRLLEDAARHQSRLLREAVVKQGSGSGAGTGVGQRLEWRAAAAAACTRDLVHELAVPGPASTRRLRRRVLHLLRATSRRHWLEFPCREPDGGAQRRFRAGARIGARTIPQVAAVALIAIIVYGALRSNGDVPPELLTVSLGLLSILLAGATDADVPTLPGGGHGHTTTPEAARPPEATGHPWSGRSSRESR